MFVRNLSQRPLNGNCHKNKRRDSSIALLSWVFRETTKSGFKRSMAVKSLSIKFTSPSISLQDETRFPWSLEMIKACWKHRRYQQRKIHRDFINLTTKRGVIFPTRALIAVTNISVSLANAKFQDGKTFHISFFQHVHIQSQHYITLSLPLFALFCRSWSWLRLNCALIVAGREMSFPHHVLNGASVFLLFLLYNFHLISN